MPNRATNNNISDTHWILAKVRDSAYAIDIMRIEAILLRDEEIRKIPECKAAYIEAIDFEVINFL